MVLDPSPPPLYAAGYAAGYAIQTCAIATSDPLATWLIHVTWLMAQYKWAVRRGIYVPSLHLILFWHASFICATRLICVAWNLAQCRWVAGQGIPVTWFIHMWDMNIHVTWLIVGCDMPHSYVWHQTWRGAGEWRDKAYVWHDSLICETWTFMWLDSLLRATRHTCAIATCHSLLVRIYIHIHIYIYNIRIYIFILLWGGYD